MISPYNYGGYESPYSGGYGEYGVSAPRVVRVPVPVPFEMKGTVTDPGMTGRNVDISQSAAPSAAEPPRDCLLYTSPSPRDRQKSRMPSSA